MAAQTRGDTEDGILSQLADSPAGILVAAHLENPPLLQDVNQASCGVTSMLVSDGYDRSDIASSLTVGQGKLVLAGFGSDGYSREQSPFAQQWQQPLPRTDTLLGKAAAAVAAHPDQIPPDDLPEGSPARSALSSQVRTPGQGFFFNADMLKMPRKQKKNKMHDTGQTCGQTGTKTDFDTGFSSRIGAVTIDPDPGGLTWVASDSCGRIKGIAPNGACKFTLQTVLGAGGPKALACVGTGAGRRLVAVGNPPDSKQNGAIRCWNMAELDHATGGWRAIPGSAADAADAHGSSDSDSRPGGSTAARVEIPISRRPVDADAETFSSEAMETIWDLSCRETSSHLEATVGQECHGCWEFPWGRMSLNSLAVVDGPAGLLALGVMSETKPVENAAVISLFDTNAGTVVARLFGHCPAGSGHITQMELASSAALPGLLVSSSTDQLIKCWVIKSAGLNCEVTHTLSGGDVCPGYDCETRPVALAEINGTPIVFSGSPAKAVKVWDLKIGCCMYELSTGNASVSVLQLHGPSASLIVLAERHQSQASHARAHRERFGEGFGDESEESEDELENMARWPAEACHGAADFDVLWDCLGGEQGKLGGRPTQTVVEYRFEPRPAQPVQEVWSSTVQSLAGKPMMHRLLDKEHGAYKD